MTDSTGHEDIRDLFALYVLQQLDERDMARVERALAADPELRRELGAYEQVGARLADSVAPVTAPASIKHNVMSSVRASAAHRAGGTLEDVADAAESALPEAERKRARSSARDRARRSWFGAPAFTGSMVAACLVLAIVAIDLGRDLDDAERRADRLEQNATSAPDQITDAKPITVSTSGTFDNATGSLVQVADDKWILLFHDVPSPGVGKSWQVWTADSNGLIENVDVWSSGDTQMLVLDRADIAEVMVSHEPTTQAVTVPGSAPVADVKV